MIEFRALGTLELIDAEGHEVHSVVAQPKPLALLAVLVLHSPDGYHRRDTLVGLLWPELEEQRARHALSQALHVLRQGLGGSVIVKRGQEELRIDCAQLWCDAVAFQEATRNEDHEAALALYRGDLLAGFFVSEAAGFERWLGNERMRFQELAAGAAWKLAHNRIAEGELVDAERTAQRALSLVATDESEVRRFVEALATAGNRAAAVRFYEKFAEQLRAEYEVEPAAETTAVADAVRNSSTAAREDAEAVMSANQASVPEAGAASGVKSVTQEALAASGLASRVAVRWVAVAAVVIAVAVAVDWISSGRARGTVFVPNRVVVAPLENQTGDSAHAALALMAADWITDGLARTGLVEVITAGAVRDAFLTAEREGMPWTGSAGAFRLAESMHAGIVVSGQLYGVNNETMIRADVVRMPGMLALGAIEPVVVTADNRGLALEALRQRVMGLLALRLDEDLAPWAETVHRPPTYEAYREFVAGLPHLGNPQELSTAPRLERLEHLLNASSLDTTFLAPLMRILQGPHVLRALPLSRVRPLQDSILLVIEQRQLFLNPVERHELESIRAFLDSDNIGAYQAARRAAELAPDRLMDLAEKAFYAGRYREVVEILERPDLPVGLREYNWWLLSVALHFLEEHERELRTARACMQENPGGAADCVAAEINSLAALGRMEELEGMIEEAVLTGTTGGAHWTQLCQRAGFELMWHGYENEGRAYYERVVAHELAQPPETQNRSRLAESLLWVGRHAEARTLYEQLASEAQDSVQRYIHLRRTAEAAAAMGDSATALRISAQLEYPGEGNERQDAWSRAFIAGALGDCEASVEFLEEALSLGWRHCFIHAKYGFLRCRDYQPFQEIAAPRG